MFKLQFKSPAFRGRAGNAYGYGRVYRSLLKYFESRPDRVRLVERKNDADIQVCWAQPFREWESIPYFKLDRHPVQVIYTTWEETRLPQGWVEELNKVKAVFTTSRFCLQMVQDNGVGVPLYRVPHAVEVEQFPFMPRDWSGSRSVWWPDKKFVFLWQAMHPKDRRNRELAQAAFYDLKLDDAWFLQKWYPLVSAEVPPLRNDRTHETFMGNFMPDKLYRQMLGLCHCFVSPTRGEGFGLMPLEAASTGMVSLATNWSGTTDYLDDAHFRPLKYSLSKPGESYVMSSPDNDVRVDGLSQDALVDYEDLKSAMLWVYENREVAAEMGKKASDYVRENWTWDKAGEQFLDACLKVIE